MPLAHTFAQVREDLDSHVRGIAVDQIWRPMPGGSLGFHLKHIAGSVDRLATYLRGEQLSGEQMEYLRNEAAGTDDANALLAQIDSQLTAAGNVAAGIDNGMLTQPRYVGRKRLETTVYGLLVHLAEHTQRHLGQSITLAHMLRHTG